jgi:hypothetical protein
MCLVAPGSSPPDREDHGHVPAALITEDDIRTAAPLLSSAADSDEWLCDLIIEEFKRSGRQIELSLALTTMRWLPN